MDPFRSCCFISDVGYRWVRPPEVAGEISRPTAKLVPGEREKNGEAFWVRSPLWRFEPPYLTDGLPSFGRSPLRRLYDPLHEHPALFRNFAGTEPTPDGILEFANRYGSLGGDAEILLEVRQSGGQKSAPVYETWGTPYSAWKHEILSMRYLLSLWDLIKAEDTDGLSRYVVWRGARVEFPLEPDLPGIPLLTKDIVDRVISEGSRPGDLVKPALYCIMFAVDARVQRNVSPGLVWKEDGRGLQLLLQPWGISGAVWLQFAQAIGGGREYRRCAECGTWFEVSPEASRTSRLYHSNACRSKAYRTRIEKARKLLADGGSIKAIAKELGTDVATVRRWVGSTS